MKCKYCGLEMELYDVDSNYERMSDFDRYWLCENCYILAFEEVRNGNLVSTMYQ